MDIRFITKQIHAYLDYPVALGLIAMPFILSLGTSSPLAFWLSIGTGIAAFILTLLTDHQFGLLRILPYSFHLLVDGAVGVVFLLAPSALEFTGIDAGYYWLLAATVLVVVGLHKPAETAVQAA